MEKSCLLAGVIEDSLRFTRQLKDNWGLFDRYTNEGGMLNEYHTLMGRHALREGEREQAIEHLLLSAEVKRPSATMKSFGPNTTLARELLLKSEDEAVLAYLDRIARFWKAEHAALWKDKIAQGKTPARNIPNLDKELKHRDDEINPATMSGEHVAEMLTVNTLSGYYDNRGYDIRFHLYFGGDGTAQFGDRYSTDTEAWSVREDGCIEARMRWNDGANCHYLETGEGGDLVLYPGVYSSQAVLSLLKGRHDYVESACRQDFGDQDYAKALQSCRAEAEANDMQAQNLLGVIYERHLGEQTDLQQAMRWYQRAADQGERYAPFNLAQLYRTGQGGVQDLPKAVYYYQISAQRGYGEAQFSLGVMHFEGAGTPVDMQQAKYWWEKARASGVARAEDALSRVP